MAEKVAETVARNGIALHPKYYGAKLEAGMKLPGDTRLFRDIKLCEVPQWIMKRNFTPLGMWFWVKRLKWGWQSKYLHVRAPKGHYYAQLAVCLTIGFYLSEYIDGGIKNERHRKYH
ncbi:ATP synthase F(0) complex subunit f, mitochondrial [Ciona intestinalis]